MSVVVTSTPRRNARRYVVVSSADLVALEEAVHQILDRERGWSIAGGLTTSSVYDPEPLRDDPARTLAPLTVYHQALWRERAA